jgi:large subunit ribosomal protein L10
MALSKEKKKEIYAKLTDVVAKHPSFVFVKFNKLTVADASAIRRALRAAGVGYFVAKKTLIKKAFANAKITGDMPSLDGEVAIAWSNDVIAPSREVYQFQKKLEGIISLLGGVFEGRFIGKDEALALAAIPSRQTLLGMFVNLINSPIQRTAIVLDQIAQKKV